MMMNYYSFTIIFIFGNSSLLFINNLIIILKIFNKMFFLINIIRKNFFFSTNLFIRFIEIN
jgi:hypothetical protein